MPSRSLLREVFPGRLPTTLGVEMEFSEGNSSGWDELWTHSSGCDEDGDCYDDEEEIVESPVKGWHLKDEHCGVEFVFEGPTKTSLGATSRLGRLETWVDRVRPGVDDAGVHIHLGSAPHITSTEHRIRLSEFLLYYEPFFHSLVPLRRALGYNPFWLHSTSTALLSRIPAPAPRVLSSELNTLANRLRGWGTYFRIPKVSPSVRRFATEFTIHGNRQWFAWSSHHPTLEIRLLEGTTDFDRVNGWITLFQWLWQKRVIENPGPFPHAEAARRLYDIPSGAHVPDTVPEMTIAELHEDLLRVLEPPAPLRDWINETSRLHHPANHTT